MSHKSDSNLPRNTWRDPQENNSESLKLIPNQANLSRHHAPISEETVLPSPTAITPAATEPTAATTNKTELTAYHRWMGLTSPPVPKPLRRFKTPEERLRWRAKLRGTLPPSAETPENLAKSVLDFPALLMPREFYALTHRLPEAEQRTRLGAMMSLRGKLWSLVRAEDAAELSRIYEQPTTVNTIKAALTSTDMPKIFWK